MFFQKPRSSNFISGMLLGVALGGIVGCGIVISKDKDARKVIKRHMHNTMHTARSFLENMH